MNRLTAVFGIAALTTASMAMAQVPTQEQEQEQERYKTQKTETFMGEIASVDKTAKTITVKKVSALDESQRPGARPQPDPMQPEEPEQPEQPATHEQHGQRSAGETMTFNVDAQTKITAEASARRSDPMRPEPEEEPAQPERSSRSAQNEQERELDDLKVGDRVSVKYEESGSKKLAKSIQIMPRVRSTE